MSKIFATFFSFGGGRPVVMRALATGTGLPARNVSARTVADGLRVQFWRATFSRFVVVTAAEAANCSDFCFTFVRNVALPVWLTPHPAQFQFFLEKNSAARQK
jgi:hypothetical protein